jgi:hypothetical protein
MYFRVYCNQKEIEAPDMETAKQILKDSLTETPVAPPAIEIKKVEVKEKKGGHGSMTFRH